MLKVILQNAMCILHSASGSHVFLRCSLTFIVKLSFEKKMKKHYLQLEKGSVLTLSQLSPACGECQVESTCGWCISAATYCRYGPPTVACRWAECAQSCRETRRVTCRETCYESCREVFMSSESVLLDSSANGH